MKQQTVKQQQKERDNDRRKARQKPRGRHWQSK